jgi:hypothetical protein
MRSIFKPIVQPAAVYFIHSLLYFPTVKQLSNPCSVEMDTKWCYEWWIGGIVADFKVLLRRKKKADLYNTSMYSKLLKDLKAEIFKVIILSDNPNHYFSQFRVTTLAAISVCCKLGPWVLVQHVAVNIEFSLAVFKEGAVSVVLRLRDMRHIRQALCQLHFEVS